MALQSLSNMASQIHSSNVDQTINIVGNGYQGTFIVNSVNARVLQIQPVHVFYFVFRILTKVLDLFFLCFVFSHIQ